MVQRFKVATPHLDVLFAECWLTEDSLEAVDGASPKLKSSLILAHGQTKPGQV
jgi:hypothetical protein